MTGKPSSVLLVLTFCIAEALLMAGFALVPSLLPQLSQRWSLSATAGGWLGGIFFLGYILAVPVLVSLTDRIDARRIYLAGATVSALALTGFANFADGLASGLGWWWLAGLGLAGTYMPGLKALTDRLPVAVQARGSAFYTAGVIQSDARHTIPLSMSVMMSLRSQLCPPPARTRPCLFTAAQRSPGATCPF
jgi:MFS family permease